MSEINQDVEYVESKFLAAGVQFVPAAVKTVTTKKYGRVGVKILDESGDVWFSTASKIVKVFVDIDEALVIGKRFTVVQKGVYNGYPVLSVTCDDADTNRAIMRALF